MEVLVLVVLFSQYTGDLFYREGDYFNAVTEYKRALYFSAGDSLDLLRKIALCNYKRSKYGEAVRIYSDIIYNWENAEVSKLFALNLLRAGNYEDVLVALSERDDSATLVLKAIAYGFSGKFDSCFALLDSLQISHPHHVSYNKVLLFSRLIPGSGLLYFRQIPLFLGSLALTGASGYLIYSYARKGLYFEAITTGFPLLERFYRGSVSNTRIAYKLYYEGFLKTLLADLETNLLKDEEFKLFNQ